MNDEILTKKIKNKSLWKMLFSIPFIAAGIFLIVLLQAGGLLSLDGYFTPYDMQGSISKIDSIVNKPFALNNFCISIKASVNDIIDTGIQETENGVPVSNYLAVFIDNKYILCQISKAKYDALKAGQDYTFTGALFANDKKVVSMVVSDMTKDGISEADANKLLYAYTLDTQEDGILSRTILYLFVLVICFFGIFLLVRGLLPQINIYNHPQIKKLSKFGALDIVLPEIERQFGSVGDQNTFPMKKSGNVVYLLRDWIVIESLLNIKFFNAADLLWAYKMKQTTKQYGIITTNVSYFLKLNSKDKTESVFGKEQMINNLLEALSNVYPWAIVGYSELLESTWKTDIGQFVSHADTRKASM